MTEPAPIAASFKPKLVTIRLDQITPLKTLRPTVRESAKYRQIVRSVQAVGLVEHPVVFEAPNGGYLLLDGQLRLEALKDIGVQQVDCLVATEEETFTYNKRVSRLSPTHEHRMIQRALELGVTKAALANALGVEPSTITRRIRMLKGIAPEVAELLKDTLATTATFQVLRQMKPIRQYEAAELMIGQGVFSRQFATAILAATPPAQLQSASRRRAPQKFDRKHFQRMEQELSALQIQIKALENGFALNALHLTVAKTYLRRLLSCAPATAWLARHRPEYLAEFQALTCSP